MERWTLRLEAEQDDWVEERADDRSKSAVVRDLIDEHRNGTGARTAPDTAPVRGAELDDLRDRVDELEARLASLERGRKDDTTLTDDESGAERGRSGDRSDTPHTDDGTAGSDPGDVPSAAADVLASWVPGDDVDDGRAREAARQAVAWLVDVGGRRSKSDFLDALHDESYHLSERVWWERAVQPALRQLADADLVEYRPPGHSDYRWIGK